MAPFFWGIILFILITLLLGLAGKLLYLIYLPFKRRLIKNEKLTRERSKQINTLYICSIVLISAYLTFNAFFPNKHFYEEEFNTVTLRDIPKSAVFIEKSSSYPDLHGDYCSSSQIRLSSSDYQKLLQELEKDNRMTKQGELIPFEEFYNALDSKKAEKIIHSYTRQIKGKEYLYYYIGFYDDGQTIFVNLCVT